MHLFCGGWTNKCCKMGLSGLEPRLSLIAGRSDMTTPLLASYREIPLNRGLVAIVDPEDYDFLMQWKWHSKCPHRIHYASRCALVNGKHAMIMMHRALLNAPSGTVVDHIDHDGLNNRRSNIRLATVSENAHNSRKHKFNKSGFKGVCRTGVNTWAMHACINGKKHYKYNLRTAREAAQLYDALVIEHYGSVALTNKKLGLL